MGRDVVGRAGESRSFIVRILLIMVWVPIQITLSLFFATGGMMILLLLGITLGPFVALFLLIRRLVRGPGNPNASPEGP